MISAVLARRYARALLDLAQRRGDLKETHQDLESVARVFERDPRVRRFFEAPSISRVEKEVFLEKRFKPKLASTPTTMPPAIRPKALLSTILRTSPCCAPSAMRMPISCLCRDTV